MRTGRPTQDLTGLKFGKLTVIGRDYAGTRKDAIWKCVCECGNTTCSTSTALTHGAKKSCGCYSAEYVSKSKIKDLKNQRFGRLVALERVGADKNGLSIWQCKCDCGNICDVKSAYLLKGHTRSCGCLHKETFNRITHSGSKTRLYRIWRAMRDRCYRVQNISYSYYGGKGIKVCEEWSEFPSFRDWAISNGYADNLSIDRIDSSKDYYPENCRWITQADNAREAVKVRERNRTNDRKVKV